MIMNNIIFIGDSEISFLSSLDPVTMNTLSEKFGNFFVDCMANSANEFCSRYSSPGTFGVKFFRSDSLSEGLLFSFC
jgi:hypothetical protein